jgi:hypothetical protein
MNGPGTLPLRDIHLPEAVSWWPSAYGWWLLAVVLAVLAWVAWWMTRRRPGRGGSGDLRTLALRELDALEVRYRRSGDARAAVAGVSVLLRRLALSLASRQRVAGITGAQWWHWLRQHDGAGALGPALAALGERAYRPDPALDVTTLLAECRGFIASLRTGDDTT